MSNLIGQGSDVSSLTPTTLKVNEDKSVLNFTLSVMIQLQMNFPSNPNYNIYYLGQTVPISQKAVFRK